MTGQHLLERSINQHPVDATIYPAAASGVSRSPKAIHAGTAAQPAIRIATTRNGVTRTNTGVVSALRPNPQHMRDGIGQIGAVQRVNVELIDAIGL